MADLVEREPTLAALRQRLQRAAVQGHVVLVAGEAGIGKSSLLRALAAEHAPAGPVWWGACDALQTPHPLGPLLDMARSTATVGFASRLSGSRSALFEAVLAELQAAQRPVLVVVEDAHWADEATLDLLKFLGRRIDGTHALLAVSYRDDEVGLSHPLHRLLGDLPSEAVTRLKLNRLSPVAVAALAQQALRAPAGLFEATQGNPFFLTELLRSGVAEVGHVPSSVQSLVLARFARLPAAAQAVVRIASLVPTRIEHWLVDALLPAAAGDLQSALDSGLLQADAATLQFRHELARVAIEASLAPPVARSLHAQILRALVQDGRAVPHARLVHHAQAAGDAEALRRHAPAAAAEARQRGAHREAVRHDELLLQLPLGDDAVSLDERTQRLEAYAASCHTLDRLADALRAREELEALLLRCGDVRRRGLNLARTAMLHVSMLHNAQADAASEQAIALLETLPPSAALAAAYGAQGSLRMLDREPEASAAWCLKAIALAEATGDRERQIASTMTLGVALLLTDHERGCAKTLEALDMARDAGLPALVANALNNLGSGSGEYMHLAHAERWLREAMAYAAAHELDGHLHYATAWLALVLVLRGQWSEAADLATGLLARSGATSISRVMATIALGRLRARRGDPGAATLLDEALALAGSSETLQRMAPARAARAEAAWLRGDLEAVRSEAQDILGLAQRRRHAWFSGELLYWLWKSGEPVVAGGPCAEPYALQMAGCWHEAADAWATLGCPYERARALAEGDAAAMMEALAVFVALGAAPAADAVRRQLREAGVRGVARGARPSTRSHPCGLTATEMKVLALLAGGLRNADIAQRLHRSVRTVDHHVAAVLGKLAVPSRAEAVQRAEREGWFAEPSGPAEQSGQSGQTTRPR